MEREQADRDFKDGSKRWKQFKSLEERVEKEGASALDDQESAEFDSLCQEIGDPEAFLKYLAKLKSIAEGRKLADGGDRTKKREAMLRSINLKLAAIAKPGSIQLSPSAQRAADRFREHVRSYLTAGNLRSYDPPPGVTWILPG